MKVIKSSLKVLVDYAVALLIFGIFLIVFLQISGDRYSAWVPLYSFILFMLFLAILYGDMKKLAEVEKRPQYGLKPHPLNGLLYGFIGIIPVFIVEVILYMVMLYLTDLDIVMIKAMKTVLGPIYWIARAGGLTVTGYIITFLSVPLLSMLSYMAGYYNVKPFGFLKKTEDQKPKEFVKSPWNPSVNTVPAKKKVKRKANTNAQGGSKSAR